MSDDDPGREVTKGRQAWIALDGVEEALAHGEYDACLDRIDSLREHVEAAEEASES